MLFNSYIFIFAFLPIVLLGFLLLRHKAPVWSISWIVVSSLFYYGWWDPKFLLLLIASVTVNLIFGKIIIQGNLPRKLAKFILTLGVIFNLGMLAYFKYAGFLITNINELFKAGLPSLTILLPIGISFITFQKIAFLVDAYRGHVREFTILNYIFFVTFFPQLIAGPIVHHAEIMPQLANAPKRDFHADFAVGISIFIVGLFKKVVVADALAVYADAGYGMVKSGLPLDTVSAWITVLCYALQLYYDFSGYSDMAVGLGRMFGIRLPLNFDSPYKAASIIDFWRRWHMTLSRFLRDYLYFPLGGNQKGPIRRYMNLMLVMLLGGLWHGANWTFAIWGGIHGLLLMINHAWAKLPFTRYAFYRAMPIRTLSMLVTFICVVLAWIPFRAETMTQAQAMFHYLIPSPSTVNSLQQFWLAQFSHLSSFSDWFKPRELWPPALSPDYLATMTKPAGLVLLLSLGATFLIPNTSQLFNRFAPVINNQSNSVIKGFSLNRLSMSVACIVSLLFAVSILRLSHISPFLYFQF